MLQKEQDLIAQDIVRCAREVYIILGNGFQEIVYKRALSAEMLLRKIEHQRGYKVPLFYKCTDIGQRVVDFLVAGEIPVDIKAIGNIEEVHLTQAQNFLETYNFETGLLINFGAESLQFKRLFNPKNKT
jgi:GxxExxY protein